MLGMSTGFITCRKATDRIHSVVMKFVFGMLVSLLLLITCHRVLSLPCSSIGTHRNPNNCREFYYCYDIGDSKHHSPQQCPGDLYFDPATMQCRYQNQVDCTSTTSSATTPPTATTTPSSAATTPSTAATTPSSATTTTSTPGGQSGYKRVCYFTNWSTYRSGTGKFTAKDIDTSLCTHIIYAFAKLNAQTFALEMHDANVDIKGYTDVTAKKSNNLKALLAVGGWSESATGKYSAMVTSQENRAAFIRSAVTFVKDNNFDGLDLDWEYPKCWQGNCNLGPVSDKGNYAMLVEELKEAFDKESPRLMLTSVLAAAPYVANPAYDIPSLSRNVDFFNVMTYDYRGSWNMKTGHHAQLKGMSGDDNPQFNIDATIKYYLNAGAPASKLIVGVASYGKSFTLSDSQNNGLNDPTTGAGNAGEFTRMAGTLAFYEICQRIKVGGWTKVNGNDNVGPYAYNGNQWVGYLDVDAVDKVATYVKDMSLGGVMFWTMDFDDFNGVCCSNKSPLQKAAKAVLTGTGPSVDEIKSGCS